MQGANKDFVMSANIIFGATFDNDMDDEIRVTVIATGFDEGPVSKKGEQGKTVSTDEVGLFTAATEKAREAAPAAEQQKAEEEDPFDSIFKIFNSK